MSNGLVKLSCLCKYTQVTLEVHRVLTDCTRRHFSVSQVTFLFICKTELHHIAVNCGTLSKSEGWIWVGVFLLTNLPEGGIRILKMEQMLLSHSYWRLLQSQSSWEPAGPLVILVSFFPTSSRMEPVAESCWPSKTFGLHTRPWTDVVPQEGSTHTISEGFRLRTFFFSGLLRLFEYFCESVWWRWRLNLELLPPATMSTRRSPWNNNPTSACL